MRGYFKGTATPHDFLNVAIKCIVLINTAFSQARHASSPSSLLLLYKMRLNLAPIKIPTSYTTCKITHVSSIIIKEHKVRTRKLI